MAMHKSAHTPPCFEQRSCSRTSITPRGLETQHSLILATIKRLLSSKEAKASPSPTELLNTYWELRAGEEESDWKSVRSLEQKQTAETKGQGFGKKVKKNPHVILMRLTNEHWLM